MDTLALRELNFIVKSGVSVIFLEHYNIHNVSETWILESCLRLTRDTEWKTKVGHNHTCIIGGEHQISSFYFALWLVWASITVINAACEFKH